METLAPLLPLTFVMIAGPQIISAVFLATSERWAANSLAYIVGAAISITAVISIAYFAVQAAKGGSSDSSSSGDEGTAIDVVLLLLLLYLAYRTYRGRNESEPPKWMGKLQAATPGFSFKLGFLLLGVFPTDIITSVTVGTRLAREGEPWALGLIFMALTLVWLAVPALLVVLMGKRAQTFLPRVRNWMNTHSWIVSEIVIGLFVVIQLNSLLSN
jgi:Sap, sulfolipid-1-addressing protein